MTTRSEELERTIADERRELGRNLDRLQDRLHEKTNVKGYVTRNPGPMLGVALGAGMLLGLATGGSGRSYAVVRDDDQDDDDGDVSSGSRSVRRGVHRTGRGQLRTALLGMAAARISELVLDRLADYLAARRGASRTGHRGDAEPAF